MFKLYPVCALLVFAQVVSSENIVINDLETDILKDEYMQLNS